MEMQGNRSGKWSPVQPENTRSHSAHEQHPLSNSNQRASHVHQESPRADLHKKPSSFTRFADGVMTFSLGFLFFSLPIFVTGITFQGAAFDKQILFYIIVLFMLVAWTTKGVVEGEMRVRKTPLDIPLVIFLVVYAASTFFSVDRWHSFWGFFNDPSRGLMNIIALVVVYYAIVSHFDTHRFRVMVTSLVVANFLLACWSLAQLLGVSLPGNLGLYIPLSLLGSLSGLGTFLAMVLPVLMMLVLRVKSEDSKIPKLYAAVIVAFLLVNMVLNIFVLLVLYGFVSWASVMSGVGIFLIFILARIVRPAGNWMWIPVATFFLICSVLMIGNNSIAKVSLPSEVTPSYQMSIAIAKESLANAFLVGSGPASYAYDFSRYRPKEFNLNSLYNLRFYQGKGLLLEGISTIGVLGTIALLIVALSYIGTGLHTLLTDRENNKIMSLGLFSASCIGVVSGLSERMEGPMIILSVMVISLAIGAMLSESKYQRKFLPLSLKASPKYALALAFVFMIVGAGVIFMFVFIGKTFVADVIAGSAVREKNVSEQGSISKLAQAILWNNREGRYFTRIGQEYLILANTEALKSEKERNVNLIQNYLQVAIQLSSQGRDMMPYDVLAQETLAQTYENAGFYSPEAIDMAEQAYKKGLELEPHNTTYMIKIGQIKIAQGTARKTEQDIKDGAKLALDWFQKAVDEKQNLALGYYYLSFAKEVLSDIDGAISDMEKAVIFENANAGYKFNLARLHQAKGADDDNKIAEALYKNILQGNDKDANTRFNLGMLYEKMRRPSDATAEYKRVLELIPEDQKDTKVQVQKMIDNIARGVENTPDTVKMGLTGSSAPAENQASNQGNQTLMQEGQ